MLTTEPSGSGQQVTLRASGILRILPAGFLTAWLCGWAVGERNFLHGHTASIAIVRPR